MLRSRPPTPNSAARSCYKPPKAFWDGWCLLLTRDKHQKSCRAFRRAKSKTQSSKNQCLIIYYTIQRGFNDVYSSVNVTDCSLTPLKRFPVKNSS